MSDGQQTIAGYLCALGALAFIAVRCWLEQVDDNLAELDTED